MDSSGISNYNYYHEFGFFKNKIDGNVATQAYLKFLIYSPFFVNFSRAPSLPLPFPTHPPTLHADICSVVDVSYQSVKLDLLRDYLGGLDDDSLSQLAASRGGQTFTREDETKMMEIRKQEATIKT